MFHLKKQWTGDENYFVVQVSDVFFTYIICLIRTSKIETIESVDDRKAVYLTKYAFIHFFLPFFLSSRLLFYRMDRTVKHIEVLLDEATQKYRVKDESDAVCYANFLQFDSIQQLLDQCKQHPSNT